MNTILDDIVSSEDEDIGARRQVNARLNGLTKRAQQKLIHDWTKRISNDAEKALPGSAVEYDYNGKAVRSRPYIDDVGYKGGYTLEQRINMMPEKVQDSWLMTALNTPYSFVDNAESEYNPSTHSVVLNSLFLPRSVIHEYGHGTMFQGNPSFMGFDDKGNPINAAEPMDVFGKIGSDVEREIGEPIINGRYDNPKDSRIRGIKFIKNSLKNLNKGMSKKDVNDLRDEAALIVEDAMSLNRNIKNDVFDDNGHDIAYRDRIASGFGQFVPPSLANSNEILGNAALSMETSANIFALLSRPGGKEWLEKNAPATLQKFFFLIGLDRRPGRFIPPIDYDVRFNPELDDDFIGPWREW